MGAQRRKYHRTFETLLLILLCTQGSRSALATSSHSRKSSVRSWTWNASCRRTWGVPGSRDASPWGGGSGARAPLSCCRSLRRRTPVQMVKLLPMCQSLCHASLLSYLWPPLLVLIRMGRAVHLEAVGFQRAPLCEWLLTMVALVGSDTWNCTCPKLIEKL